MSQGETSSSPRVRAMTLEDVEAVYDIDVRSYSLPWSLRAYQRELTQNPNARLWVAELPDENHHDRVVGMVVTWIILDEAHIGTIATHPAYRQRGVAAALLRQALRDAAQCGAKKALLEVRRNNLPAQRLYVKFGFIVAGIRPRYYQDNQEDAVLMNLDPLEVRE